MLNFELNQLFIKLHFLNQKWRDLERRFFNYVDDNQTFRVAFEFFQEFVSRQTLLKKETLIKKFNQLYEDQNPPKNISSVNWNWIVNLSTTDIPSPVKKVLKFGLKFAYHTDRVSYVKFIADTEFVLTRIKTT